MRVAVTVGVLAGASLLAAAGAGAASPVVQRFARGDVGVVVRGDGLVELTLGANNPVRRRLAGQSVSTMCTKLLGDGRPNWYAVTAGQASRIGPLLRFGGGGGVPGDTPPFDVCGLMDMHGHVWPDTNRWALEVPLTDAGRRWQREALVERDLENLARSGALAAVLHAAPGGAPPFAAVRTRFGPRLQALRSARALPAPHRVGYFSDGRSRAVLAEVTPFGRRLFVVFGNGRRTSDDLDQVRDGAGPPPDLRLSSDPLHPMAGTMAAGMAVFQAAPRPGDVVPTRIWQTSRSVEAQLGRLDYAHARKVLSSPAGWAIPAEDGQVLWTIGSAGGGGARFVHHLSFATGSAGIEGLADDQVVSITGLSTTGQRVSARMGRNAFWLPRRTRDPIARLLLQVRGGRSESVRLR